MLLFYLYRFYLNDNFTYRIETIRTSTFPFNENLIMILTIFVSDSDSNEEVSAADEEASLVAFADKAEHHELLDKTKNYSDSERRVCCNTVSSSEKEEELGRKRSYLFRGHMDG